jgi:hypothetical protein
VFASSGNRTRAARVAGEHSTTEPTMLHDGMEHNRIIVCEEKKKQITGLKAKTFAVGRIRTYARRAELISSQSP